MTELHPPMHFFTYDIHRLGSPLERFSTSEFNEGIAPLLKKKQYTEVPTRGPEHIKIYASTFTSDQYLVICHIEPYHFITYIHDDQALLAWRREYEQIPASFLAQKLLPPPKTLPEMVQIPMNMRALYKR